MQGIGRVAQIFGWKEVKMSGGTVAEIAAKYGAGVQLCDGTNGTPDLRDRFIVGARQDDTGVAKTNVSGSLTKSGGAATHTHNVPNTGWGLNAGVSTAGTVASGTNQGNDYSALNTANGVPTDAQSSLPPYYALCFLTRTADWA
jgi:hypothetical protein